MKKFYLALITIVLMFVSIINVSAISVKNVGGVTGYGSDGANAYSCTHNNTNIGVLEFKDTSDNNYFCTECNKFFPCTTWGGCSTSYTYNPTGYCYLTCTNPVGTDNGLTQHNIWDNFINYNRENRVSCTNGVIAESDLLASKCTSSTYVLTEYAYEVPGNDNQKLVSISSVDLPENPAIGVLRIYKVCGRGIDSNTSFTFQVNGGTASVSCGGHVDIGLAAGTYDVTESANDNYVVDQVTKNVTINVGERSDVTFTNTVPTGSLTITKTDGVTGAKLANVQFKLYKIVNNEEIEATYVTGNNVGTLTTNDLGVITVNNLPYGSYVLKETLGAGGNYAVVAPYEFTLSSTNKTVSHEICNNHNTVNFTKTDINGNIITGTTVLLVADTTTNKTINQITLTNGVASVNFENGNYTITEMTAPTGYDLLASTINIKLAVNNGTIAVVDCNEEYITYNVDTTTNQLNIIFKNENKKINFYKKDGSNGNYVDGAILKLFDNDGKEVASWTTSNNAYKLTLPAGSYVLKEEVAPEGYELLKDTLSFQVDDDMNITTTSKSKSFVIKDNTITINNVKPINVPNTGVGTKIIVILLGISFMTFGGYLVYSNVKKNKFEAI